MSAPRIDMTASSLDWLARAVSRRRLALSGLGALALGLAGSALDPAVTAEAKKQGQGGSKPKRKKTCKKKQKRCGKKCVNLATSHTHCGVCGNTCQAHEHCANGACWYDPIHPGWGDASELGFVHAGGLTFNPVTQRLLVADSFANKIVVVSMDGTAIGSWGSGNPGTGANDYDVPAGIGMGLFGTRIYVTDTGNSRIKVLNKDGSFVAHWGAAGGGWNDLNSPTDLAVSPDGSRVYVADTRNHRVKVMDTTGVVVQVWGSEGTGTTQFKSPTGVAVSPDGQSIYVTDRYNHRVKRYSPDGKVLAVVGGLGDALDKFDNPVTVACDPNGSRVYVVEANNKRIQELNSDLTPVTLWAQGQLGGPYGITMIASRQFVVTDVKSLRKFVLP